jgi:hypothetical protein
MSMAQITAAAEAMAALSQEYHGKIDQINAVVAAKSAEVDQFVLTARNKLAAHRVLNFDPTIMYSKTGMNIAVDPTDPSRTQWVKLNPMNSDYFNLDAVNDFAALRLSRAFSFAPGEAEVPLYATDYCSTSSEFILSKQDATSAQINAQLGVSVIVPAKLGQASLASVSSFVPILAVASTDPFYSLWVRFSNSIRPPANKPPGTLAQAIGAFGGNAMFRLIAVNAYQK